MPLRKGCRSLPVQLRGLHANGAGGVPWNSHSPKASVPQGWDTSSLLRDDRGLGRTTRRLLYFLLLW